MLALVGSGEYLAPMEAVDRYLLSKLEGPAQVVCLPTAAGRDGPEKVKYWMDLGTSYFTSLGVEVQAVEITNRTQAHEPRLVAPLLEANFVYLSGGKPDYLYQTLEGTKTWAAIQEIHARGGVVAGCSAGAMILGEKILGFPGLSAGFGLLPGKVILPHFDEFAGWMVRVARFLTRGYSVVGIEGNTALVVTPEERRVVGSGRVVVLEGAEETRYRGGELLPD